MNEIRNLMLVLLGETILDLLGRLKNEKIKSCSTLQSFGDKKYRLTLEEVE